MLVEIDDPTQEEIEAVQGVMDVLEQWAHDQAEAWGEDAVASAILSYACMIDQHMLEQDKPH